MLMWYNNPPKKSDYFAKRSEVDLCLGCALERDECFTSSINGTLAVLKEVSIEVLEERGMGGVGVEEF